MPSLTSSEVAALGAPAIYRLLVANYCGVAGDALVVYDYLIMLPKEVKMFWGRPPNVATFLYFANRYTSLCATGYGIFSLVGPAELCQLPVGQVGLAVDTAVYIPPAVFSALRVYALSQHRGVALLVFILSGVAVLGVNLPVYSFIVGADYVPGFGCFRAEEVSPNLILSLSIMYQTCNILGDIIIIIVTWRAVSKKDFHDALTVPGRRTSFRTVILYDGMIYFIALVILNILVLVSRVLTISGTVGTPNNLNELVGVLTPILVSRFLLDLQEVNQSSQGLQDTNSEPLARGHASSPRGLGSLGASVQFRLDDDPADDDEMLGNSWSHGEIQEEISSIQA